MSNRRPRGMTDEQFFWLRVRKTETCWMWTGSIQTNGYGQQLFGGKLKVVHRLCWELVNGPIPKGMVLDHFLRNDPATRNQCSRSCVNPAHLRLCSHADNVAASRHIKSESRKRCIARKKSDLPEGLSRQRGGAALRAQIRLPGSRDMVYLGSRSPDTPAHRAELAAIYQAAKAARDGAAA